MTQEQFWAALDDYFEKGIPLNKKDILEYTDDFERSDAWADFGNDNGYKQYFVIYIYRDKWVGFEIGYDLIRKENEEIKCDLKPIILHREVKRKTVEEVVWIDDEDNVVSTVIG